MQASRKRPLEYEEVARIVKIPRRSFGGQREIEKALDEYSRASRDAPYHDVEKDNALHSQLNGTESATLDTSNKSVNSVNHEASLANIFSPTRPFTYQPLDEYLKAEALRLLFIRNGLHHKKPRADIQLFNEGNLAPYMEHWQDCFSHWYPLMGSGSVAGSKDYGRNDFSDCKSPIFGQNFARTLKDSNVDLNKPDFQPTIAKWGNTSSIREDVRPTIQSEVRKQLDNPETQTNQSETTQLEMLPQTHRSLDLTSLMRSEADLPSYRQSRRQPSPSSKNLDDTNLILETDSIHSTTDGSSTLVGENDGSAEEASD